MTGARHELHGGCRVALRWLIVALALSFIGALHTCHVAADQQSGVTVAAMTLFSPAVESAHATAGSDVARPASAAHHDNGEQPFFPLVGTCLLVLTVAVSGILIVALGRIFGPASATRVITVPRRRLRRFSASLTQLCVQRT